MSVPRYKILRGGGRITYRGVTVYTNQDIVVQINSKVAPVEVAMFGKISDTKDDVSIEVSFTPSGEVTTSLINLFLPFFNGTWYPGQSPFDPNTDYLMVINSRDGRQLTIVNAACSSPASLICAANKLFFGQVKFTGLRANGAPWSQAGSLFTETAVAYPGDTAFNRATIVRQPFSGRWLLDRSGTITAATNANPSVITTAADHGLLPGDIVTISGALGNTAINGTFTVAPTSLTETTFSLYQQGTTTPIAGNGAWTSGGTFTRANV
ncbi:MAG: hypothetical protein LV479_08365, partial [Methylacidiphilales bacterium]|nr:hypothetical protein [Candidatus Methylacidiphilales bacterium]